MKYLLIGNGFDIAHGLPTKWTHFKGYIDEHIDDEDYATEMFKRKLSEFENELNEMLFWNDVETYLGDITAKLTSEKLEEMHKFIFEFTMLFQNYLIDVEKSCFLQITMNPNTKQYLDSFDKIYTTNYTNTLEKIYKIPSSKIVHLHGQIVSYSNETITCIIGCDDQTYKIQQFSTIPNMLKLASEYEKNPKYFSNSQISKLGIFSKYHRMSGELNNLSKNYINNINALETFVKRLHLYKSNLPRNGYQNELVIFGFSFGKSDSVINKKILRNLSIKNGVYPNIIIKDYKNEFGLFPDHIYYNFENILNYDSGRLERMIRESKNRVKYTEDLQLIEYKK